MKSLVFDVNVILDLWLERRSEVQLLQLAGLLEASTKNGYNCWVCSSSLHVLEYITRRELKKNGADPWLAKQTTRKLLAELIEYVSVLSCFGFQQDEALISHTDLEDAQIVRAASLINGPAAIVTNEKRFDTSETNMLELKPEEVQGWLKESTSSPIEFVDLKSQQDQIRPALEKNIHTVLHHGKYIMGPEVAELEDKLADYVGVKHCIGVASGSDALLMALMAIGIGPGDEVITTPFTFIATGEMISLLGAKPVFVDIDPQTCNIDPNKIEAAITPRTRAIIPVSLYGQPADFDAINAIAKKHNAASGDDPVSFRGQKPITVIEDAAQSFGATYKGRRSCALSDIACTSFFPSKPLGAYGDGGACFTDDDAIAATLRQIRVHGQDRRYHHPVIGINGRLDTLQAAIVLAKFDIFPEEVALRQQAGQRYTELLHDVPQVTPPRIKPDRTSVFAQYTIQVPNRDQVQAVLKDRGIPTVVHYPVPLYRQPAFADLGLDPASFPVAEAVSQRVMSLPMHAYVASEEQQRVYQVLQDAVRGLK